MPEFINAAINASSELVNEKLQLTISIPGKGVMELMVDRDTAESLAHALVMPFRRAHLAREIARLISECDDPQPNDEGDDHAQKPH